MTEAASRRAILAERVTRAAEAGFDGGRPAVATIVQVATGDDLTAASPVSDLTPPRRWPLALGLITSLALTAFTSHKLYVGAMLRGDLDGIPAREMVIGPRLRHLGESTWEHSMAVRGGQPRFTIQLDRAQGSRLGPGDVVIARCHGDDCYLPDSVYISDGNRSFDAVLLTVEVIGAFLCGYVLARRQRAWRRRRRGAHLPVAHVRRS